MSEHLPECPRALHDCERCDRGCYCNELRAREQRVRHENPLLAVSYKGGYNDGLIDAREAVEVAVTDALEALDPLDPQTVNRALAAIDALRKESDG